MDLFSRKRRFSDKSDMVYLAQDSRHLTTSGVKIHEELDGSVGALKVDVAVDELLVLVCHVDAVLVPPGVYHIFATCMEELVCTCTYQV